MTDYLLRAENESDMDDALLAAGVAQEVADLDGEVFVVATEGITLDRIGPIPAQLDPEDGTVIRPADNRYHVNLRATVQLTAAQVAELPVFSPAPTVPYRVFI
jgi:hypothetical protein